MRNATNHTCRTGYLFFDGWKKAGMSDSSAFEHALIDLRKTQPPGTVLPTKRSLAYWRRLYKAGHEVMPKPMNKGEALLGGSPFDESNRGAGTW